MMYYKKRQCHFSWKYYCKKQACFEVLADFCQLPQFVVFTKNVKNKVYKYFNF